MIFRQLFDSVSGTYSYLLASRAGGEALILDPVLEKVDRYCQLLRELDLKLVKAVDTHLHADHVTGLGELRDRTHCVTIMGEQSKADVVSMRVADGDKVTIEGLAPRRACTRPATPTIPTAYLMGDRVFTGDTLLIRGTGRTDFQNGSARAQYEFDLQPAAEAAGRDAGVSRARLQGRHRLHHRRGEALQSAAAGASVDEYVELMGNLNLPNPKMMDVAVPANMHVGPASGRSGEAGAGAHRARGDRQPRPARYAAGRSAREQRARQARHAVGRAACALSGDRRKPAARRHAARGRGRDRPPHRVLLRLRRALGDGGAAAKEAGLANTAHIAGGIDAWKKAGGPVLTG